MSEIPTPETDAFILSQDYSPTGHQWRNFTRQLERKRDEVKEKLADWENSAAHVEEDYPEEKHCACVPVLRKLLADARKERDEAREAFVIATDQMVIAQGKMREANKERDEAREALREAWLAMDEVDGTDRMVNWQNKNANILEDAK